MEDSLNPKFDNIVKWLIGKINHYGKAFEVHVTGLFPKDTPWLDRYLFFYVNWASFHQTFHQKGVLLTLDNEHGIVNVAPLEGSTFKRIE